MTATPPGTDLEAPPEGSAFRRSSLGSNLVWSLTGEGVRLASSFAAFLILAWVFTPAEIGLLLAATAVFSTLVPFAGVGGAWLVLERVTKQGWSPGRALAVANGMMVVGSMVLGLAAFFLQPFILPELPRWLFLGVGLSEMVLLGLVETTLFAAQATERLVAKAVAWSVYGLGRAAGALLLLVVVDEPTLGHWIVVTILVGFVVLVVAQLLTLGRPAGWVRPGRADLVAGLPYSVGFGAERLLAATDSLLLVRLSGPTEAGWYGAGRRLLTVTIAPVVAALHAVSARLWSAGGRSAAEARRLAAACTAVGAVYGLAAAAGWWLVADRAVALVLEPEYEPVGRVLRWLSVVPLLLVAEVFVATALTGSGHHRERVMLTLAAGALNVALNLVWIPGSGWRGAVAASLLSSAFYVAGLWLTMAWVVRRERHAVR